MDKSAAAHTVRSVDANRYERISVERLVCAYIYRNICPDCLHSHEGVERCLFQQHSSVDSSNCEHLYI